MIHAKLGDSASAIKHLELAMKTEKEPAELPMRQLLAVYLEAGRDRDAAVLLQQIISLHGGIAEDWRRLSAV